MKLFLDPGRRFALALALCCGVAAAQGPAQPPRDTAASASTHAPAPAREAVLVPLREAQELLAAGKFTEALARIAATDAIAGKTPGETYFIERLRAPAASGAKDTAQAAKSLEAVLASGRAPREEQAALIEALAIAHYQLKRYPEAARWASRYVEQGGSRQDIRLLRAQALYLSNDYSGAALQLQGLQREYQAANVPVPEAQLDMLAGSYIKLQDDAGYMRVLEQLLREYPRADYWADLLIRLERKPGFAPRLVIDLFRLQFAAGALGDASEYLELAQLSAQAGYSAEGKDVLDAGFKAKVLGVGPEADRHLRYRQQMGERALAELGKLDESAGKAAASRGGEDDFNFGYMLATQGRTVDGLAVMAQALAKGGLPPEARLRLATAYARAGDKARALETLRPLQDPATGNGVSDAVGDGVGDLARLWGILLAR